jgi:hypothetical protein
MPKFPTIPVIIDYRLVIKVSDFNINSLKAGYRYTFPLSWYSSRTHQRTLVNAEVVMEQQYPYIVLNYELYGKSISYEVALVSIPSNIGRGVIWYFLCPQTFARCRKLHFVNGRFYHRSAFPGYLYDLQTYGHKSRWGIHQVDLLHKSEAAVLTMNRKYFKPTYRGQYTKRYLKCAQQIKQAEGINIEALMVM